MTPRSTSFLSNIMPGLPALLNYKRAYLRSDLMAGVSVAAVALPIGVAYAELAGFSPVVGLYSSILPLVAYALFGTSRQLIVGPDAATCAIVAAAVAPLAAGNSEYYLSLSILLAFCTGLFCILASFLKLGVLADFLSRPIMVGFMNGIAISIILGQMGKLFGFDIESGRIIPRFDEFLSKLELTHIPTLLIGIVSFILLWLSQRFLKRVPAAMVVMIITALLVELFNLDALGVKVVGPVPGGLPHIKLPVILPGSIENIFINSAGIALISITSAMLTVRSFATKNKYDINVNHEFAALGVANIISAISQGFAISGADSRTAMNDAAGGKTQVVSLVAAAIIAAVLMFFTVPLRYVPIAALGAVLINVAVGLFSLSIVREIYRYDRVDFALCILSMVGVITVGAIKAILVAVVLSLLRFIQLVARPYVTQLGLVKEMKGIHNIEDYSDITIIPGLLLFRFEGPIVFFNTTYFKEKLLGLIREDTRWVIIDSYPITYIDSSGYFILLQIIEQLSQKGIRLCMAGHQRRIDSRIKDMKLNKEDLNIKIFSNLQTAVEAFILECRKPELPGTTQETTKI